MRYYLMHYNHGNPPIFIFISGEIYAIQSQSKVISQTSHGAVFEPRNTRRLSSFW